MITRLFAILTIVISCTVLEANAQYIERVVFDNSDSTNNIYLAVPPRSHEIKGVVVVVSSFYPLNALVPETKLHNVAYANDLLTVFVSVQEHLYADSATLARINTVMQHVITKYKADPTKFVLAGYDFAGNIALRYTELTRQFPARYPVSPQAVFTVSGPVDVFGLWNWCERIIRKNYNNGQLGDAGFIKDLLTRELGTPNEHPERYQEVTPFNRADTSIGHEQYLHHLPVRVYYDTDIAWMLKEKHNSLYDTYVPEASELISRLIAAGNTNAEFISAAQPGRRINGQRYPDAFSIVDETDCVLWIKRTLDIFDPVNYHPSYKLNMPPGWAIERFPVPIDFAPEILYKGVEDVRFAPGWGDSTSEEHWSYAFLWWLQGKPVVDAPTLSKYLTAYYNGLVQRNIISRKIPVEKQVPTVADIRKVKTLAEDTETYSGTVKMLNYLVPKPQVLNCLIHVRNCTPEHTAIFFEVSPQPATHAIRKQMDQLWRDFRCE